MRFFHVSLVLTVMLSMLIGLSTLKGGYPLISDFDAYDRTWADSADRSTIFVDDADTVTVIWDTEIDHPIYNQYCRTFYRRYNSLGMPLSEPLPISDTSRYSTWSTRKAGHNSRGKWVLVSAILWVDPNWPHGEEGLMAWASDNEGVLTDTGFAVGDEVTPKRGNRWATAAVDSAGNFVICWINSTWESGNHAVWCQLFNADNSRRTDTIRVSWSRLPSGEELVNLKDLNVAMTPRGDPVITWSADCYGWCQPTARHVLARVYYPSGVPKTDILCVSCGGDSLNLLANCGQEPDVAVSGDGEFAVTWKCYIETWSCYNNLMLLRSFYADGTPKGQQVVLDSGVCGLGTASFITSDSSGNVVVTWLDDKGWPHGYGDILAWRFDPAGNPLRAKYRVNDVHLRSYPHPFVSLNNNGLVGLYWSHLESTTAPWFGYKHDLIQLMDLQDVGVYSAGDANADKVIDVSDAVYLINHIFNSDQPPFHICAGDANGDGVVDISDIVTLIEYIFASGSIAGSCP